MSAIIDRKYCITHPHDIIRLFGISIYLSMLFSRRESLLECLTGYLESHGNPMPGQIGHAYKLSALLEYRMARIYRTLAQQYSHYPKASELFDELSQEEMEHGRLMDLCRYTVRYTPKLKYLPSIRDSEIAALLSQLRHLEQNLGNITLSQALDITEWLEQSEINAIFHRLLKQVGQSESYLFDEKMDEMEGHDISVPERIQGLRITLNSLYS